MSDAENDERLLDHFRTWLREAREEASNPELEANRGATGAACAIPGYGLERLVEEFTALRHEMKLQARGARSLEELVGGALSSLADAAATFRSAASKQSSAGTAAADKAFAATLAELDDALERGREQWQKSAARLIGGSVSPALSRARELYAEQSWWQRRLTGAYHRQLYREIEGAEVQDRGERQTLLTALLSGSELIRQRLARAMASAGVLRIPTLGRVFDPELMVVVEVSEADGPAGLVVEEIRRGYTWKDGLLRPAEVRAIRARYPSDSLDQNDLVGDGSRA
jgi:molecular chaperone GrpE